MQPREAAPDYVRPFAFQGQGAKRGGDVQVSPAPSPREDAKMAILEVDEHHEGRARRTGATEKVRPNGVAPEYVFSLAFRGKEGKGEGDSQVSPTLVPRKREDRSREAAHRSSGSPGHCTVDNRPRKRRLDPKQGSSRPFLPFEVKAPVRAAQPASYRGPALGAP